MIIRAVLLGCVVVEVPITQHPGPDGRVSRLRRFRDGWRHLKAILVHAPDAVLLKPGALLWGLGFFFFVPQLSGRFELGFIVLDIHLMLLGALLLLMGLSMVGSAAICAVLAGPAVARRSPWSARLSRHFELDATGPWIAGLFVLGLVADVSVVVISVRQGFGGLAEPRLALAGTTGMGLATQLFVLSFVRSVIEQHLDVPGERPLPFASPHDG